MTDKQNEELIHPDSPSPSGIIKAETNKKNTVMKFFGAVAKGIESTKDYITNTRLFKNVVFGKDYVTNTPLFKKILSAKDYIIKSHLFKIATSKIVSHLTTITFVALALAGVTAAGPFGPVVAGVLAGVALASVAVSLTVDMLQARSLRNLEKENNVLVKNRDAKEQQVQILKDYPKLENILKDQLLKPEAREGKKSVTERLAEDTSKGKVIAKGVGKAFLMRGLDIALSIVSAVGTAGLGLALKLGGVVMSAVSLGMEASDKVSIDKIRLNLKKQIDSQRDKPDTPGYNNIKDLKIQVREQRIQTLALKELISNKNYSSMSPEQIKAEFATIKEKIAVSEKTIGTSRNMFVRGVKAIGSVIKDFGRGANPYSRFNNPEKIVVKTPGMKDQPPLERSKTSTRNKGRLSKIVDKLTGQAQVSKHVVDQPSSYIIAPIRKSSDRQKSIKTSSIIRG
jgi:hypothetical protein